MRNFNSRGSGGRMLKVVATVALIAALLVGYKVWQSMQPPEAAGPVVTIAQTAGTTDEVDVVWPVEVTELLTSTAQDNGTLLWVKTQGVATETVAIDLTPRTGNGDEVKPVESRATRITEILNDFLVEMNGFDATGQRSTLAALQGVAPGTGPVLVAGSGLDTIDPLRFEVLGFDASIDEVVAGLEANNELPKGLAGREVWLVFLPTSGAQAPLRAPDKEYRDLLHRSIVEAAGGNVTHILESGAAPAGTGGSAPTVPVPPPPGTFTPEPEIVRPSTDPGNPDTPPAVVQRCVLPSGVLFHGDNDVLLDESAAKSMVATCLGDGEIDQVELIGHTAKIREDSAPDNPRAMELSQQRADRIARLIIDGFSIDPTRVTARGVGATQPLTQPDNDPGNRSVEVIVTYASA